MTGPATGSAADGPLGLGGETGAVEGALDAGRGAGEATGGGAPRGVLTAAFLPQLVKDKIKRTKAAEAKPARRRL